MVEYFYIIVILYNLNLILGFYIEVMIKIITNFNYKSTGYYFKNYFFLDIYNYIIFKNEYLNSYLLSY